MVAWNLSFAEGKEQNSAIAVDGALDVLANSEWMRDQTLNLEMVDWMC